MKTFMKALGIMFAIVAVAFTACGILDYFCNTGRGTYFEIEEEEL